MNCRILWAVCAAAALTAPMLAQDTYAWTGFHAGINLGYADAGYSLPFHGRVTTPGGSYVMDTEFNYAQPGFVGGGQFGYDWLLPNNWLVGIETDAQAISAGIDLRAEGKLNATTGFRLHQTSNIDFLNTLRGRLGYVLPQNILVYGTAGFAYGGVSTTHDLQSYGGSETISSNFDRFAVDFGWTAGAGVEYPLSARLSLRAEYLYADLGEHTFLVGTTTIPSPAVTVSADYRQTTYAHMARLAINYAL